jgi:hypothetical protein
MSTLEVNKITPQGVATEVTLGDSGDTFTIPSGVTLTNNGTASGFPGLGKIGQVVDTKPITYAEALEEYNRLYKQTMTQNNTKEIELLNTLQIGDQLDKLWHSINADDTLKTQFADFYNTIKAVKDKYPKE